jgi:hypothetical protein
VVVAHDRLPTGYEGGITYCRGPLMVHTTRLAAAYHGCASIGGLHDFNGPGQAFPHASQARQASVKGTPPPFDHHAPIVTDEECGAVVEGLAQE